ncbi:MAG: hypothetical protein P8I58_02890 [Flavobacteriaceae bacterium]|jgi:hypothetical protein|nr:hypothetical protein [Flavobacteriaceae bacterium]
MENQINHNFRLRQLPKYARIACLAFVFTLSVGYFTGLAFVFQTESNTAVGIEENYNGNEDRPDEMVMKFKKGQREMLTIVHTHILSISLIFFSAGILLFFSTVPKRLKSFLLIEPYVSLIVTFGGIYLLWYGWIFMAYVVLVSGVLMTLTYVATVAYIVKELFASPQP